MFSLIKQLCIDANYYLCKDIKQKIVKARDEETWDTAKGILDKIVTNAEIASNEKCQYAKIQEWHVYLSR